MSLTLKDVVENRMQQRASGVRRDPAETQDAAQNRRERFSLEESDRRAAVESQTRSASVRADATRAQAAKNEASNRQDKPIQADRPSTAKSEPDRQARPEATRKPASPRPAGPAQPGNAPADTTATGRAGEEASASASGEAGTRAGKSEAAAEAKTGTEAAVATSVMPAAFVVPPASTVVPSQPALKTGGAVEDNDSGIEEAGGGTEGLSVLNRGIGATTDTAVAAKLGFEETLAGIGAAAAGGEPVQSIPLPSTDSAAVSGALASSASSADAKGTAAVHQQATTPALPGPVPLGAVPMTIGLRALGASNRFEIRLDPKELGRIDVSIDIDKDTGTVGARLVVDRPETLVLLQRDASSLQQALSQTGLDASAGISLSLRGDGEGQRSNGESGAESPGRGNGRTDHTGARSGTETSPIDHMPLRALGGLGRVDIRI